MLFGHSQVDEWILNYISIQQHTWTISSRNIMYIWFDTINPTN